MRILVLPDIHHNFIRAQSIIESVPHDRCILLGDYFDSFGDSPQLAQNTAVWLRDYVLPNKKITPLIGNHDVNYIYDQNIFFRCSGFSQEKNIAINEVLKEEHKEQLKYFHIEGGFVFSHAGLSNVKWKELALRILGKKEKLTLTRFEEILTEFVAVAHKRAKNDEDSDLFAAGWDRGGIYRNGGITWVDWSNFSPIQGINQFVGHSRGRLPRILIQKVGGALSNKSVLEYYKHCRLIEECNKVSHVPFKEKLLSVNYCLDTGLNHYAVIENKVVDIFDHQNRINLRDIHLYNIPESELNNLS